ncbi:SPOSA6832_04221, partial [Sporobolomyces salmonicolor]
MSSPPRTLICGIGGPTCSGKTTLAKHLARIIPDSLCLFEDDFAPPSELIPTHPVHGFQDWDDPAGAIQWEKQRAAIRHLRETGDFPESHSSHDHMNEQVPVPISDELANEWRARFERLLEEEKDTPTIVLAEGFLIMYDQESVREFDVRLFVREDYATLKQRRYDRHGYHTAGTRAFLSSLGSECDRSRGAPRLTQVQSNADGTLWRDPENYWDLCVWPAYLKAHRPLFVDGDVESGAPDPSAIEGVELFEAKELGMDEMVRRACERIYAAVKEGKTSKEFKKP